MGSPRGKMELRVTRIAMYRVHREGWRGWLTKLIYGNGPLRVYPTTYKPQTSAPWSL